MQVAYKITTGGLQTVITRTTVRDVFGGIDAQSEGGAPDIRRTVVDEARVVVMDHAVLHDDGEAFRTNGTKATPQQIVQAIQDDVFRPAWALVSETDEPI